MSAIVLSNRLRRAHIPGNLLGVPEGSGVAQLVIVGLTPNTPTTATVVIAIWSVTALVIAAKLFLRWRKRHRR